MSDLWIRLTKAQVEWLDLALSDIGEQADADANRAMDGIHNAIWRAQAKQRERARAKRMREPQ